MDDRTTRRLQEWRREWRRTTDLDPRDLDELGEHLRASIEALQAGGMGEDAAIDEALRRLGPPARVAREYTKVEPHRSPRVAWAHDLRLAFRQLRRQPFFSLVAVVSVGIAIAANTLGFSVIDALLLEDPGYGEPERLVDVYTASIDDPRKQSVASWPIVDDLRAFDGVFEGVVGYEPLFARSRIAGEYRPMLGEVVDGTYFEVLGVPMALGRAFTDDDAASRASVAVLSWRTWKERFGGDRGALGSVFEINGRPFSVIGVAPASFRGTVVGLAKHAWVPRWTLPAGKDGPPEGEPLPMHDRDRWLAQIKARLRRGVSAGEAESFLVGRAAALAAAHPESYSDVRFRVIPTEDVTLSPALDRIAFSLAGAVMAVLGVVLVIACMNLAGFLLARGADRWHELQLRQALGATRRRLVAQLFTESLVVALLGGALGVALSGLGLAAMRRIEIPIPVELDFDFSLDGSVLVFSLGATVLAAVLFGLLPAWHSTSLAGRRRLTIGEGERVVGSSRIRSAMLTIQVAVSTVFLVAGALFVRSLQAEAAVDPGFRTTGAGVLTLEVGSAGYSRTSLPALTDRLREAVSGHPEVADLVFGSRIPLGTITASTDLSIPAIGADSAWTVQEFAVSRGYFEAMRIPLLRGRPFAPGDDDGGAPVVIISRSLADRLAPEGIGLGGFVDIDGQATEIVGVARDVRVDRPSEPTTPHLYRPLRQTGALLLVAVATARNGSGEALRAIRGALRDVDPSVQVWGATTLEDHVATKLMGRRISAGLLAGSAGIALLLTLIGLSGSVRYAVARRAPEMAVRMSLGAPDGSVVRLLVGSMLRVIGLGAAIGLAAAGALTALARGMLFGVGPLDPWSFAAAVVLLGGAGALAAWWPARRVGRVDLTTLLRAT